MLCKQIIVEKALVATNVFLAEASRGCPIEGNPKGVSKSGQLNLPDSEADWTLSGKLRRGFF